MNQRVDGVPGNKVASAGVALLIFEDGGVVATVAFRILISQDVPVIRNA